jgi:hypothetical protein
MICLEAAVARYIAGSCFDNTKEYLVCFRKIQTKLDGNAAYSVQEHRAIWCTILLLCDLGPLNTIGVFFFTRHVNPYIRQRLKLKAVFKANYATVVARFERLQTALFLLLHFQGYLVFVRQAI